jgi:archaellum component FlaC
MNNDSNDDLKQFIATTVSHLAAQFDERFNMIYERFDKVDNNIDKIDGLSVSVAEAIETSCESADIQLEDHEQRIKSLEQKAV